jgi:hypothetical protein
MPCGIFMQRFSFVGMNLHTLPQSIVGYLQITFKASKARVDLFIANRTANEYLKNAAIVYG